MTIYKKIFKVLKKAGEALWWVVTVLLAVAIMFIMAAKIKGEIPYVFGYSVMHIVSGSMEDTIPEGTYILIKKTDPSEIRKGDIICFYSDDPNIKGLPNTHIVVEEPIPGENGIEFVTKGEANPLPDKETAKGDKLIGKHIKNLDALTSFSKFLDGSGIFIVSTVLLVLCSVFMVASAFLKIKKASSDESEGHADEAQTKKIEIDTQNREP